MREKSMSDELPSPSELMPLSQSLITPNLALAFNITTPNISDLDSSPVDEPARTLKRPRLVWTPQLHKRFVDAVAHLGIKNAVPKTIMQLMSVDGLTRENVASHLQKYRLYLKRMQQGLSSGAGPDAATDQLFATTAVPAHFLRPGPGPESYGPYGPVTAMQQYYEQRNLGLGGNVVGGFDGGAIRWAPSSTGVSSSQVRPLRASAGPYVEELESGPRCGSGKMLTLFPTGE